MVEKIREASFFVLMPVVIVAILYGFYYAGKTVSYKMFYEDMVEQSIRDNVIKSCIRK